MAAARVLACAVLVIVVCLLQNGAGTICTVITKSLIGLYREDYKKTLREMFVRDGQCNALISPETIDRLVGNDKCLVSSLTVEAVDGMPPEVTVEVAGRPPRWGVSICRKRDACAGECNVTVTVTCQEDKIGKPETMYN